MANRQSKADENAPLQPETDKQTGTGTFTTDVSETDDEGTTVREAEVREDDLAEVRPSEGERGGGSGQSH
ncbi:hypothetical protein [Paraburkholderia kururiensis]|uniref:Multidrug transporter n=1 Tax=Paraburkholderia kururiensis TaxID=984307 RepID=A0ABZ0WN99_9BURK|nr:hypothetical protein [Paraburkholderia kururiensis]WQD78848.1 hypothetical protein U0042_03830 [Paraburkholderia kururiensis]